jgi:hypothetical protein
MGCSRTTTVLGAPPKVDWKRASDGIGLCVWALFLLLTTTGVLPWSFWMEAISLWPLLILSAGIQITFEKTRAPWLVLLGPAVVLAGLTWVATGASPELASGNWKSEGPLPLPEGARHVTLDLELLGTRLAVEARDVEAGALADARSIERNEKTQLQIDRQDDTARLRLDTGKSGGVAFLPGRKQRFDLGVPRDLPVALHLQGAMSRTKLDLAQGRFEGGEIKGAFLATELVLPPVEETVKLVHRGAFCALRLNVPKGTPVTVRGNRFPFNIVKSNIKGDPGRAGYEIQLETVFSAIALEVRPADKPAETSASPEAPASPASPDARPKPEAEPTKAASPAPDRG